MTTPPVPQWAVDAAKAVSEKFNAWYDTEYDATMDGDTMARIIAAHAPQGDEEDMDKLRQDRDRLDWIGAEEADVDRMDRVQTYWFEGVGLRDAIDSAIREENHE